MSNFKPDQKAIQSRIEDYPEQTTLISVTHCEGITGSN